MPPGQPAQQMDRNGAVLGHHDERRIKLGHGRKAAGQVHPTVGLLLEQSPQLLLLETGGKCRTCVMRSWAPIKRALFNIS